MSFVTYEHTYLREESILKHRDDYEDNEDRYVDTNKDRRRNTHTQTATKETTRTHTAT